MNLSTNQVEAVIPVTAVAITDLRSRSLFVVGQGCKLKIFDKDNGVLLATEPVFKKQAIHGIQCQQAPNQSHTRCLVWGGRSIAIFKLIPAIQGHGAGGVRLAHRIREYRWVDWISDASLLLYFTHGVHEEGSLQQEAVFLTSHNVLYSLCRKSDTEQTIPLSASSALLATGPSSILYSAHILAHDTGQVFVAAGTVFGEVLFWRHDLKNKCTHSGNPTEGELLYSFLGHEGSVFGVRISELPVGSYSPWVIASCSDDRTIRVWDISDALKNSFEQKPVVETVEKLDTGFGSHALQRLPRSTSCLASIMGHSSRIWGVRFLPSPGGICKLISVGEDATCQSWLMTDIQPPQGSTTYVLRALDSYDYHIGKNVWAITVKKEDGGSSSIFTGGADGRIVSYSIPQTRTPLSNLNAQQWTAEPSSIRSASSSPRSTAINGQQNRLRPGASQAKLAFDSMQGHWGIHRVLRSAIPTYPSGTFNGTASVTRRGPTDDQYGAEYLYVEEGDFTTKQGVSIKGSRSYVYRFQDATDSITAWFVKTDNSGEVDYLFHRVEFDKTLMQLAEDGAVQVQYIITAKGHHLCVADTYNAEYNFQYHDSRLKSWGVKYEVKGPKKVYVADATYTERSDKKNLGEDLLRRDEVEGTFKSKQTTASNVDSFKNYCWIEPNELICCTAQGLILRSVFGPVAGVKGVSATATYDATLNREISWDIVDKIPDLASYSVATSVSDHTVLFGAACGTIYRYQPSTQAIDSIQKLPRKVAGLFAQQILQQSQGGARFVATVASCLGDSSAYCFFFKVDDEDENSNQERIKLQLPPNFVITSACFTKHDNLLVLGSRNGALAFYDRSAFSDIASAIGCYCIRHVRGEDAVTVIEEVPRTEAEFTGIFLLTAGRDGKFAIHRVSVDRGQSDTQIELETVHSSLPPFGPNIEGAAFDNATNDLLLWGFRSTDFVVWNGSKQTETMKIACGGSHRSWAYSPSNDGQDGGKLVWTKASTCNVQIQPRASHRVLQPGGHGREIKAMAISSVRQDIGGRTGYLIATGAEDTTVRISLATGTNSGSSDAFKCLGVNSKHNTGLQQICWSPDGRHLFTAGGREELFIWRIQPVPCLGIGFTCQLQAPAITDSLELRVMDFDVAVVSRETDSTPTSEYLLSTAYSDSTVRIHHFSPTSPTPQLTLLATGKYTTSCLTQIQTLHLSAASFLLTAATDGYIALWPLKPTLSHAGITSNASFRSTSPPVKTPEAQIKWTTQRRIHQNSIKTLTLIPLSATDILIATGGDDGAIAFTRLTSSLDPSAPLVCATLLVPRAHASSVTGIQSLGSHTRPPTATQEGYTSFRLVSVSNDQRLKTWVLSIDLGKEGVEGLEVGKERDVYSEIADASCVEVLPGEGGADRGVVVAGIGVERWGWGGEGVGE
ncbi:hypothetical protein MMC30_002417 [Trapelia coarctata]|nr:hypothetical protein [Trapelia coarctata]